MSRGFLTVCIAAMAMGGVLYLTWLALNQGPAELMALAAVLTAGAAFVANIRINK